MAEQKLSRVERNQQTKSRNLARRKSRQHEAESRVSEWRNLSSHEQLAELDKRLGKGQGAKKQRKRIMEKIRG